MKHKHWTEESADAFVYRIASDFVEQLEQKRKTLKWTRKRLAHEVHLSTGRVSQVINNPGNLTLELIVKFARALQMKVSVLAYEDKDPENVNGPINAEVFRVCWENARKPTAKWQIDDIRMAATIDNMFKEYVPVFSPIAHATSVAQGNALKGEMVHAGAYTNSF